MTLTRAQLIERTARNLALKKHGTEDCWTVCISEASQMISMMSIRARDAREGN